MTPSNTLGFDEVVDTLGDALEIVEQVHDAVKDGLQITDLVTLFSVAPKVNEIRKDAAVFAAQLQDLTPGESEQAAIQLAARSGQSQDGIVQKGVVALHLAAEWHATVSNVTNLTTRTVDFGKNLFKKAA